MMHINTLVVYGIFLFTNMCSAYSVATPNVYTHMCNYSSRSYMHVSVVILGKPLFAGFCNSIEFTCQSSDFMVSYTSQYPCMYIE